MHAGTRPFGATRTICHLSRATWAKHCIARPCTHGGTLMGAPCSTCPHRARPGRQVRRHAVVQRPCACQQLLVHARQRPEVQAVQDVVVQRVDPVLPYGSRMDPWVSSASSGSTRPSRTWGRGGGFVGSGGQAAQVVAIGRGHIHELYTQYLRHQHPDAKAIHSSTSNPDFASLTDVQPCTPTSAVKPSAVAARAWKSRMMVVRWRGAWHCGAGSPAPAAAGTGASGRPRAAATSLPPGRCCCMGAAGGGRHVPHSMLSTSSHRPASESGESSERAAKAEPRKSLNCRYARGR